MRKNLGITLIALIITIIVLLILAGVSISVVTGDNGVLSQAQESKIKSDQAYQEELRQFTLAEAAMNFEDQEYTENDKNVIIPKGFAVSQLEDERHIDSGLVIMDSKGNEWVWIEVPAEVTADATNTNDIMLRLQNYSSAYNKANTASVQSNDIWYAIDGDEVITENTVNLSDEQKLLKNGCGLTYDEYILARNTMLTSIKNNNGFWISRYEIGAEGEVETRNGDMINRTGKKPVSKKDQIPYTYVTCSEAQMLANSITNEKNSSLLFGIQWNLVCKYLETKSELVESDINEDSTKWGNYDCSTIVLNRGKYNISPSRSSSIWKVFNCGEDLDNISIDGVTNGNNKDMKIFFTTGASENTKKMNIYDLAGNASEYTLSYGNSTYVSVSRGGDYGGVSIYCCSYGKSVGRMSWNIGFRATMY